MMKMMLLRMRTMKLRSYDDCQCRSTDDIQATTVFSKVGR
jgi:hypothetical protein